MDTEIARQIRAGVMFGKAWADDAIYQHASPKELETRVAAWKMSVGKLSRKAFERTLNRHGIYASGGMYYWPLR